MPEEKTMLFSQDALRKLLWPLIIEQFLAIAMGMADTVMAASCGEAVVSGISLVDSICVLLIGLFTAMASGGAVVAAQYMGHGDKEMVGRASNQLFIAVGGVALLFMTIALIWNRGLLALLYGNVEADVMSAARIYFYIVAVSFPFLGIYNGGAALFRAVGDSKVSMKVSLVANLVNIAGNAVLIFGFHMGVAGAAISTLASRILMSIIMICRQRVPKQEIVIRDYFSIRPDMKLILIILSVGIPSGIENGMFQFGKLAIQSTVSTLGTTAIAAQAMTIILENLNGIAAIGIGIGLMTIVGQCIGAGEKEQAVYYIKKLAVLSEVVVIICCLIIWGLTKPITMIAGMEPASADMCFYMMTVITIVKPIVWVPAFIPPYGLRAAGDVKFSMILSTCSMWIFRVSLCIYLCRAQGFGPIAVWIGMFTDWTVRSIVFTIRFHRRPAPPR